MNTTLKCARCGAPTLGPDPIGGVENLCPRCVMGFAMEGAPETGGLKPGSTFSHFEIIETLGRGGMGVVYKARHTGLDRIVALKLLSPAYTADDEFKMRFQREALVLGRLSHPNIVQISEVGVEGDQPFLVMEFIEGVTLRTLLLEKRLPPEEALQIVPQLCDALEYAHSRGVVHRDIKPENILIDTKGVVKIADFGLAKGTATRGTLTQSNVSMGTPHYMAPEQIENTHLVDHRADIYSMGVVFYEMLTGELPIGRFRPPSRQGRTNGRLDQIVLKALENKPEDRYQQASHVKNDITRMGNRYTGAEDPGRPAVTLKWLPAVLAAGAILMLARIWSVFGFGAGLLFVLICAAVTGVALLLGKSRHAGALASPPARLSGLAVSGFLIALSLYVIAFFALVLSAPVSR